MENQQIGSKLLLNIFHIDHLRQVIDKHGPGRH